MASKNDITLDTIWNKPTEAFRKNLENVDFSVKLQDHTDTPQVSSDVSYRYLEVSPERFNFVSMAYQHPDHNLKLTFHKGVLVTASVIEPEDI
jgi:hypothetical protein